jgi:hypothetical protein
MRRRKSLFASSLDNSGSVDVELPRDADPTERRLLLAAALLIAS